MHAKTIAAVVAAVSTQLISLAYPQSEQPGAPPSLAQPPNQSGCGSGSGSSPRSDETTGSRSLSDRLAASKGVICPPAGTDPGITVPPVGGGRMPVIPPPGTPGGDQNLQPK